jgi:hypothetical protein
MPRTTIDNRARKARIRARETRKLHRQLDMIDALTEEQFNELVATLRKVEAGMESGKLLKTTAVPNWRDLRAMGLVREVDGEIVLSAMGGDVLDSEDEG